MWTKAQMSQAMIPEKRNFQMLATAWPRLHGWLDDETDDRQRIEHLQVSARGWESTGRPRVELYRGQRLARMLAWRSHTRPVLEPLEALAA